MEGEKTHLGDLLTMVINHLLHGMILQVGVLFVLIIPWYWIHLGCWPCHATWMVFPSHSPPKLGIFGRIFSMNVFLLCWKKSKVTTNDASNIICRAFDGWKPAPVEIENNKLLWTTGSCTISISRDEQCSKPWLVVLIQEVKLPSSIGIMINHHTDLYNLFAKQYEGMA